MLCDLSLSERVWAVIRSKPNKEVFVRDFLGSDGFEVYLPFITQKGKWFKPKPLFPGYLFAKISPRFELSKVRKSPNVLCPLKFSDQLAILEDETVEFFKGRQNPDGIIYAEKPDRYLRGQIVRINEGSFAGLQAVVLEYLGDKERVRLLLQYFGRDVNIEVPESILN